MAARPKLTVNNKVFKYKDTFYQITQIASVKVVIIKKVRKDISITSLKPLKYTIPFSFVLFVIGGLAFSAEGPEAKWMPLAGLALFLIGIGLFIHALSLMRKRAEDKRQDKYHMTYGLSLRMSGGDDPIFMTTNKDLIYKIRDAIVDAMNQKEGVNITMQDVNIDISDSQHVEIVTIKAE